MYNKKYERSASSTKREKPLRISKSFASKVNQIISKDVEKKYLPYVNSNAVTTTPQIQTLSEVPQSAGNSTDVTRIGDTIRIRSLQFNYTIAIGDTTNFVRLIFFQWKPTTTPVASNILLDTVTSPWLSPYNHDYRQSFIVIKDAFHKLDVNIPVVYNRLMFTQFMLRKIQYVAATVTGSNKLYVLLVSDSGAAAHPVASWSGKFNFTDA